MRLASAAVAAVGLAVATYLTAVHYAGGEPACFIAGGCTVVQSSRYAELGGVPVAVLGLVGYLAILATLLLDRRTLTAAAALTGAGVSAWLTYVEVFELQAICAWCVTSAVCMVLLAALSVARLLQEA